MTAKACQWGGFDKVLHLLGHIHSSLFPPRVQPSCSTRRTGLQAEETAYQYLRKNGYRIVARNYRRLFGEIDLIGWDKGWLVFIEVKYRSNPSRGLPVKSVGPLKQRQIFRVAKDYRNRYKLHDVNCRFDVVSIQGSLNSPEIELIKGAFRNTHH
jgi:putative endonuclease